MLVVWVSTSNSQPQPALELGGTSLLGYSIVQVCKITLFICALRSAASAPMATHCVTFRHTHTIQMHSLKGWNMIQYATALPAKIFSGNQQASLLKLRFLSTVDSPGRLAMFRSVWEIDSQGG